MNLYKVSNDSMVHYICPNCNIYSALFGSLEYLQNHDSYIKWFDKYSRSYILYCASCDYQLTSEGIIPENFYTFEDVIEALLRLEITPTKDLIFNKCKSVVFI